MHLLTESDIHNNLTEIWISEFASYEKHNKLPPMRSHLHKAVNLEKGTVASLFCSLGNFFDKCNRTSK